MGIDKRTETVAREPLPTEGLYLFTKRELQRATEDFSEARVLGTGGSGKVYLGKLPSGKQVAIKRIVQKRKVDEFYKEVELLSRLRHPNLASLLGYCQHRREHILVYEYMPGGDLGCLLFRREDPVLPWDRRLRIALDCAEGLAHLHLFPEGAIVHRDIKPTNILLNESGQAKLSDFGVSKLIAPDFSHASTEIKGTTGYVDPEYFTVGRLTDASDVYSFGVVLLQLISGQKAVISTPSGGADSVVYMAHVFMSGEDPDVRNLVDPRIADAMDARDLGSIKMVLDIAYSSVQPYRNDRPSMVDVLDVIKEAWKNYCQKPEEVSMNISHTDSD
jgi:serine/threonine protein kinase